MKTSLLFSSYPFITGEKVTLSGITQLDPLVLWPILSDEDSHRFTPEAALRSPEECTLRARQYEANFRRGRGLVLGIFSNEHKLVGLLGITRVDPQVSCVTLDFILHPRYTGQGFASAAVRACTGYLFQRVDVRRIQCLVLPPQPPGYSGVGALRLCERGHHSGRVLLARQGDCGLCPVFPASHGPAP